MDVIDYAAVGLALLTLLIATAFIVVIWSAALGSPIM